MGFTMPHVFVLAGAGCAALALLLQIIGVATPNFQDTNGANSGLWKFCNVLACVNIDDYYDALNASVPDWLQACRAFGILGILVLVGCVVVVALICFMSEQKIFGLIAPILAGVGSFCALLTFAIYAGEVGDSGGDVDYGFSFALVIVAFLLAAVAAVLMFLGKMKSS